MLLNEAGDIEQLNPRFGISQFQVSICSAHRKLTVCPGLRSGAFFVATEADAIVAAQLG